MPRPRAHAGGQCTRCAEEVVRRPQPPAPGQRLHGVERWAAAGGRRVGVAGERGCRVCNGIRCYHVRLQPAGSPGSRVSCAATSPAARAGSASLAGDAERCGRGACSGGRAAAPAVGGRRVVGQAGPLPPLPIDATARQGAGPKGFAGRQQPSGRETSAAANGGFEGQEAAPRCSHLVTRRQGGLEVDRAPRSAAGEHVGGFRRLAQRWGFAGAAFLVLCSVWGRREGRRKVVTAP